MRDEKTINSMRLHDEKQNRKAQLKVIRDVWKFSEKRLRGSSKKEGLYVYNKG